MTRHNFFELAQDKVEKILSKKTIDVDFSDDDEFADFMCDYDIYGFTFSELQILFTYNAMLQTIAFSPEKVEFIMQVN